MISIVAGTSGLPAVCTPGCLHWGRKGTRGSPHLHGFNKGKGGLSSGPFCLPPGGEVRRSGLGRARLHHHLGKAAYCQWDVAALFKKRSDCEIRPLPQQHSPWQGFHQRMLPAKGFISVISRETLCWSTPGNGIASSCSHFFDEGSAEDSLLSAIPILGVSLFSSAIGLRGCSPGPFPCILAPGGTPQSAP